MTLDPNDLKSGPPAAVRQHRAERSVRDIINDPSVQATMRRWDSYRARERARLDAAGIRDLTEEQMEQGGAHRALTIGEFPTPELIASLGEKEEVERQKALEREREVEHLRESRPRPDSTGETVWHWLKRKVRGGTLKPSAASGEASAHPTHGTGKTEPPEGPTPTPSGTS